MFKIARPFVMHAVTPLHAGCGSELGVVDLPIQRERHTDYPKIESSSLKGCLRESFEEKLGKNKPEIQELFGPEDDHARDNPHAGALGFSDARTLLFPVKSMKGVYALVTCPSVIRKLIEEMELCYSLGENKEKKEMKTFTSLPENTVSNSSHVSVNGSVYLEEYAFSVSETPLTKEFAGWLAGITGIDSIIDKLVILPDNDFRDFVNISTEVVTRTKINNETGTVEEGALFTEEFLPCETLMYSLALASPSFSNGGGCADFKGENGANEIMEYFIKELPSVIQLGGDATLGKGIIKTKVLNNLPKGDGGGQNG